MAVRPSKTKAVTQFQPITGFRPHEYNPRYPGDDTYCSYENEEGEGCPGVRIHPIHGPQPADPEDSNIYPIIAFARSMANAKPGTLRISMVIDPETEISNDWIVTDISGPFDLARLTLMENGGIQFHFDWLSNARSMDGFDVVPFLIEIIRYLNGGTDNHGAA